MPIKPATDYPRLWGFDVEVSYTSNDTQFVHPSNPQFEPNFIQDSNTKPRLWGLEVEPILQGEAQSQGFSSSTSYEEVGSLLSDSIASPHTLTMPQEVSITNTYFTLIHRVVSFVLGARSRFSFSCELRLSTLGTTGAKVRVVVNDIVVWELTTGVIDSSYKQISSGVRLFPVNVIKPNTSNIFEIYLVSESGKTAFMRGATITLI